MPTSDLPTCECALCQEGADHPERERNRQFLLLYSRLDENQRRWFVALESKRLGYGGDRLLSQITVIDETDTHQRLAARPLRSLKPSA